MPHFAAAALVRSDPTLDGQPVAALTPRGTPPTVLDVTTAAWTLGVRPGMSAGEARARAPALVCRVRDREAECSAASALVDAALATSPRLEVVAPDHLHLDLAGLEALFGRIGRPQVDEPRAGQRVLDAAIGMGLPTRVGIAGTRTVATLAARAARGLTIVPPGQESGFLAPLPVGLLEPAPDLAVCFERWGIRTLGELAALPRGALLARLGPPGIHLQGLARGEDAQPFVAYVPEERWVEALALDWEVVSWEALAFVLRPLLERVTARLAVRDLGATAVGLTARLADGGAHTRRLPLVAPLRDPRTLLDLLRADLERLTLPAPITALMLEAETAPLVPLQADLFAPPRPSARELAETLGRLVALVGPARVGAPRLGDTHRPTAIDLAPFPGREAQRLPRPKHPSEPIGGPRQPALLVCRRLVPPLSAAVTLHEERPSHVEAEGVRGVVVACAGPWRTTGEWWTDTAWSREEWDVALVDGAIYRLALDLTSGAWTLDAVYD